MHLARDKDESLTVVNTVTDLKVQEQ